MLPAKLVVGRAVGLHVNASVPAVPGATSASAPPSARYHERAAVPGTGKRENERSKPGTGCSGAAPAPLSNRIRTGGSAWNAASAASKLGCAWIGSSGSVTPSTPIADLKIVGAAPRTPGESCGLRRAT